MKTLITLITGLFLITFSLNGQQPESDAVYEKITKDYTLHEDGSIDFHYYKRLKLKTHFSFNRLYGETFIIYDPRYQDIEIKKAIVTQNDGTVVPSPENAFNEVLPRFAAKAPYYNHLRELVITHAGLELDAIIELDYTLHTKPGYYPYLMANEIITESSPVAEEIITVRIPGSKVLNYKVFQVRVSPEITESDGFKEYKFSFSGIGENSHEKLQPKNDLHLPRLVFSTANLAEAQQFLSNQEALNYDTDDSMDKLISELKKDSTEMMDLIFKLQHTVVKEMNTYRVPMEYAGFKSRNPIEVWKSNGGTPFEKSILFVALLRKAGIHAEPLAAFPTVLHDESMGCLPLIKNYLVQINPVESDQIILSPISTNDQNLIYTLNGCTLLELNSSKLNLYTIAENYGNKVVMNGNFELSDSLMFSGSAELALFEKTNPYYKFREDSP